MNKLAIACAMIMLFALSSLSNYTKAEEFDSESNSISLAAALQDFAERSGYQLIYRSELAAGIDVSSMEGEESEEPGIQEILEGTGLKYEFVDEDTITVREKASDDGAYWDSTRGSRRGRGTMVAQATMGGAAADGSLSRNANTNELKRSDAEGRVMEEVTVTARKRGENMQDVPIAISAFSSEQIKSGNITNLDEIAPLTPGLNFGKQNESRPQIYIRGIGSRQFDVGAESSVGVFIDEVYVGRFSAGLSGLTDIERVEVLKGPQGTLYGRNTIGGAINVITKRPTETLDMNFEVGAGNMGYTTTEGAISGPLVGDKLLGRLSFSYRDRDGYVENLNTGTEHKDLDQASLRGKLLFRPNNDLDILFTIDENRSDPDAGLQGEYVAGLPVLATPGFLPPPETTPSRFDEYYNTDSRFERDISTYSIRADWNLDNNADLTLISAYSEVDLSEARDLDSTQVDGIEHITDEESKQITHELRLASIPGGWMTLDDRIDWIVGLYYLKEEPWRQENLQGGLDSVFSRIAASIDAGGPPAPLAPGQQFIDNFLTVNIETTSIAIFGQSTIDITEDLALTLGARYTSDEKDGVYTATSNRDFVPPIILPFQVEADPDWTSFDPKVTLEYRWTDDLMTYFVYSEGFKSGGFQFAQFDAASAQETFGPETVKTYEMGLKSQLLDYRLQLNMNVFYNDYQDLQVARTQSSSGGAPSILTQNAASATVRGFELDSVVNLSNELTLNFGYAYLDATYDKYIFSDTVDFSGNDLVRAPENTFNVTLNYATYIADGYFRLRGDYSWVDDHFFEPDEGRREGTMQSNYSLFNASASYEKGPWRISIWGRNLADEVYRTTSLSFDDFTMEYLNLPRTYGITVGWVYE